MSKEKTIKFAHGGARPNSGPKRGSAEKIKICVSVNSNNWKTAVRCWKRKPSWLVDGLISDYVSVYGGLLKSETTI